MDKARKATDRKLNNILHDISGVYLSDPALQHAQKKYAAYMRKVDKKLAKEYAAYKRDPDNKELKEDYQNKLRALTLESPRYQSIVRQVVNCLTDTNQGALDVVNNATEDIYIENYNEVANDCRKAGFKVND